MALCAPSQARARRTYRPFKEAVENYLRVNGFRRVPRRADPSTKDWVHPADERQRFPEAGDAFCAVRTMQQAIGKPVIPFSTFSEPIG